MGLRIEFILLLCIGMVMAGSFNIELHKDVADQKAFTKELDFSYTTFREVNTEGVLAIAYGTYGMRDSGILHIDNLLYSTDSIEELIAKKGTYIGSIIYLEGEVFLRDKQGYTCESEQAEYDQSTEILNITAPYVARRAKNIIYGDTLTYNTRIKESYGTVIDAVLYTVDK